MRTLTLTRTQQTADGVFGELQMNGQRFCTVEDDWRNNAPRISCIPAGTYTLRRTIFYRHGYETFEVTGVSGRSRILIHVGNTEEDLEGCIGIGLRFGSLWVAKDEDTGEAHRKQGVVASREAFAQFMGLLASDDEAVLVVRWADGLPMAA